MSTRNAIVRIDGRRVGALTEEGREVSFAYQTVEEAGFVGIVELCTQA